jgi:hypothetical protein
MLLSEHGEKSLDHTMIKEVSPLHKLFQILPCGWVKVKNNFITRIKEALFPLGP